MTVTITGLACCYETIANTRVRIKMINSLHVVVKNFSVLWFWVKRRSRSVPEFSRHEAALAVL